MQPALSSVSPACPEPGSEESPASRNVWRCWQLRQQQTRLREQRRRLCEQLGDLLASGQIDTRRQLALREQIGQFDRQLAVLDPQLQNSRPDRLGEVLNSYWSLGAVVALVMMVSGLISSAGQTDPPEPEAAGSYADLSELAGPVLAEGELLAAHEQDEFLSDRLTQLAAGIPVPAVAVSEDVLAVGGNWQLSPPEYNRARYEWVFPLRFDVEQPLPRLHSGLMFKAVDADGAACYEAPVRLAVSAEPGERVLAALVIQDRDGTQGVLKKVRRFHLDWRPPADQAPSPPETHLARANAEATPKVFKFPPRKKRTVYQPAPSLLSPPVQIPAGTPRIPQSGSTVVTLPAIPVYPYPESGSTLTRPNRPAPPPLVNIPQSGSTTIRRAPQSGSTTIRRGRLRAY